MVIILCPLGHTGHSSSVEAGGCEFGNKRHGQRGCCVCVSDTATEEDRRGRWLRCLLLFVGDLRIRTEVLLYYSVGIRGASHKVCPTISMSQI
jgi:hypothetical protein